MKIQTLLVAGLALLVAGSVPASAQMMGGGNEGQMGQMMGGSGMGMGHMMGMMGGAGGMMGGGAATGCPGMTAEPAAFTSEAPWISFALAHSAELSLTPDQVKALTTLRDDFGKEATQLAGEIRTAERDLRALYARKPVDLGAVETRIRAIADLEARLRLGRVKALDRGSAVLTAEQQKKIGEIGGAMRGMHRAATMGGPGMMGGSGSERGAGTGAGAGTAR